MNDEILNYDKITPELAEICGIHAGDGHLRKNGREFELSGSYEERVYYDNHVIPLFRDYFKIDIQGRYFPTKGTYGFCICNSYVGIVLTNYGFPRGKKSTIVKVPEKVIKSDDCSVRRSFLRGIFDTDGCVTFDRKKCSNPLKVGKNYYPRIFFASVSKDLAEGIVFLCKMEGFKCRIYTYRSDNPRENLRYKPQIVGREAIERWMEIINPKNQAKVSRYLVWKKLGHCPPRTTYKERISLLNQVCSENNMGL